MSNSMPRALIKIVTLCGRDSNADRSRGRQVLNPLDQHLRRRLREFTFKLFRSDTIEEKLDCTYSNILEP